MSEEVIEEKYIYINLEDEPIESNNLLPSPVLLSSGEANFVNEFLEAQNSPHRYILLN